MGNAASHLLSCQKAPPCVRSDLNEGEHLVVSGLILLLRNSGLWINQGMLTCDTVM